MRAFLERLMYKYPHKEGGSTFKPVGCFYSMNATAEQVEKLNYRIQIYGMEDFLSRHFKYVRSLWAMDTYQVEDYNRYDIPVDLERKTKQRDNQFPLDLVAAKELGKELVTIKEEGN